MGFLCVCKVIEYSSDQEWNQTLNDTYINRRGSWKIFTEIDVNGKCLLVLSDTLHIIIWFFLFINKVWEHEKNEWKMNEWMNEWMNFALMSIIIFMGSFTLDWNLSQHNSRLATFAHKN